MTVLVVFDVVVVGDHAHDLVKLHLPVVHYFSTFTEKARTFTWESFNEMY